MKTFPYLKVGSVLFLFLASVSFGFAQIDEPAASVEQNEVSLPLEADENADLSTSEKTPLNSGNTAWMITATALVLFMTLPGLALFYGGLVQSKNVLSVLMHCFAIACLASIIWVAVGYSLALTPGGVDGSRGWIGGKGEFFLQNLTEESQNGDFPSSVWIIFQMTFAIITPGLIVGAFVERIKFSAVMLFSALWLVVVYCPVCYWVWGGGWLYKAGVIDFAGGIVVHATAGASALTLAWMLGRRQGYPTSLKPPHNPGMVMIGASMLWVGWFGFNAGSAVAADGSAGMAMLVTHISAAVGALTWMGIEWIKSGKATMVGIATGMVAGLATITPASGTVGPAGALLIGLLAGSVCFYATQMVKSYFEIDDSLDVFPVHGVGGMLGIIMLAFVGNPDGFLGSGAAGISEDGAIAQLMLQLEGIFVIGLWTVIATYIILRVLSMYTEIRVSNEAEEEGLDIHEHNEQGYSL